MLLRFKKNIYFCNQHDRLILKMYIFVEMNVHVRLRILLPVETETSISLDLAIDFDEISHLTSEVMRIFSYVVLQNMTSIDTDDVM